MPTTIDSAGITFNDATSFTSAAIGTSQLVNGSVIASKLGTTEQKQICKAWVNFNGTTSPGTIRSSYNVSSVTKNGTGDYTVNFATTLADANYSATGTCSNDTGESAIRGVAINQRGVTGQTTSSVRLWTASAVSQEDKSIINVAIFGN